MSVEINQAILFAESLRVAGKTREATAVALGCMSDIPPIQLTQPELIDQARAARLVVVSNLSTARKQFSAKSAAKEMLTARNMIARFYTNPVVRERIFRVNEDNQGNPYVFRVEMLRDRSKYLSLAYHITNDEEFLLQAISTSSRAIELSTNYQVRGIALLERYQLQSLLEKDPRERLRIYENEVHDTVIPTIEAIKGNRDRLSWYLLNLRHEASRLSGDPIAISARNDFQMVNQELAQQFKGRGAFVKEFKFDRDRVIQSLRTKAWSLTRKGIDARQLDFI